MRRVIRLAIATLFFSAFFSSFSCVSWLIQPPVSAQTPDEKKATIAYLQGLQSADSGLLPFKPGPGSKPVASLRSTTAAMRALRYFGGTVPDRKACVRFVESCFDKPSGGFRETPGIEPNVISTAVGIMAVVELKMPAEPYADAVVKFLGQNAKSFEEVRMAAAALETLGKRSPRSGAWLEQVAKMRNPDGTYGKGTNQARATGSAVVTVLRLGGKVDQPGNVLKALKAGQRADGGFGKEDAKESDLETSYRVMRCFHMLNEKPDVAKLRAFVAKCRNADGGYGAAPGRKSTVAGTYFAAIILHWLKE